MKAIHHGKLYHVWEDVSDGLILDAGDAGPLFVAYGDRNLIVDPNDDQVEAALAGQPVPNAHDDVTLGLLMHLLGAERPR